MDRLRREGNPPAGQLASPTPQYKDVGTEDWAELQGEGGASYVKDKDVLAKLEQARVLLSGVATEDKLEQARVLLSTIAGKDFATDTELKALKTELGLVKTELQAVKTAMTDGSQKVQVSGTIMALDPETGEPKPASLEKDPDGNFVLRMYDAAPHAFDPALEAKRVIVLGDRKIVQGNITNTDALADKDDSSYPDYNNREVVEIKPPQGKTWELLHLYFFVPKPPSATLGVHQLIVRYGINYDRGTILTGEATHLGAIILKGGMFTTANGAQTPSEPLLQKMALTNLVASYEHPIYLNYINKTDVQQTAERIYYYVVAERNELP